MKKTRRIVEDIALPIEIVAPRPVTVTQRNCLDHFGISSSDFLRFVARGAFPVTEKGKLRVARYVDGERFLTEGATLMGPRASRSSQASAPKEVVPLENFDAAAALRKAGFRLP